MKNTQLTDYSGYSIAPVSLKSFVDNLVCSSQHIIHKTQTVVVNEITTDFLIVAEACKAMPVITELFATVIANTRNGEIFINAQRYADLITIEIQDRNNYNGYALTSRLQWIEPQVRKMDGIITIDGQHKLVTTISFSFPIELIIQTAA